MPQFLEESIINDPDATMPPTPYSLGVYSLPRIWSPHQLCGGVETARGDSGRSNDSRAQVQKSSSEPPT